MGQVQLVSYVCTRDGAPVHRETPWSGGCVVSKRMEASTCGVDVDINGFTGLDFRVLLYYIVVLYCCREGGARRVGSRKIRE